MERNNNGFTLVELVVVISILGVLIAILAPWYTSKIHKAKVATDWANVKSYYNEIQTDYMFTDKHNPKVPIDWHTNPYYDWKVLTSLSGEKVPMKTGMCAVSFEESISVMQDIHNASLRWEYRNLIHNKKEIDCEKSYGK